MEILLASIIRNSKKYELSLNFAKCEHLSCNSQDTVYFPNNQVVPNTTHAKYLGCEINNKADPRKELKKRFSNVTQTWKN